MKKILIHIFLILSLPGCADYGTEPNFLGLLLIPPPIIKITIAPGGINDLTEGGGSETLAISLPEQPQYSVSITITSDAQLSLSNATLVFTPNNWNVSQSISVTAIDDLDIENNHTGTITFATDSQDARYFETDVNDAIANIVDNDGAGVTIVQSGGSTDVIEGGTTDSYTVALTTTISSNVVVTINPDVQTDLGAGAGNIITLTFTPANPTVTQTVTVTAVDDATLSEGNHTSAITHTVTTGPPVYLALGTTGTVTANVIDNDTGSVIITGPVVVDESGPTSDSITVRLGYRPDAAVTIRATPDMELDLGAGPGVFVDLNFTGNAACGIAPSWCANQTITATAVDDGDSEGATHNGIITFSVDSGPAAYTALNPLPNMTATIVDNETVGVYVLQTGGTTNATEGGATDTYSLKLTSDPGGTPVIIRITPNGQINLGAGAGNFIDLTFNGGVCGGAPSWCAAQTVTVTANDDAIAEGAHTGSITHSVNSGPAAYTALNPLLTINPTITDNEKRIFVTTTTWQGQFVGNVASADAFCGGDAARPIGGTWRALYVEPNAPGRRASTTANLGDGQLNWVLLPSYDYYRVDGTTPIFTTNANSIFIFGNFTNSIGAIPGLAWTGLNSDWTSKTVVGTCTGWANPGGTGGTADLSAVNNSAINNTDALCNAPSYSLICVEQ